MRPEVRLLGPVNVRIGAQGVGAGGRSAHRGALVPRVRRFVGRRRDDLLYLFWPDSDEQKGRANLRQLLVALRALPFAGGLEAERTRVRWPVTTDVAAWAEALVRRDLAAARDGWPRPLLEGFRLTSAPEFESWLELERAAWQERFRGALLEAVARGGKTSPTRIWPGCWRAGW